MLNTEKQFDSPTRMKKVLAALAFIALMILLAVFTFFNAHRLGWTLGWIYIGMSVVAAGINLVCLFIWNPGLIKRRLALGEFTKIWDAIWAVLFVIAIMAVYFVVKAETDGGASREPGIMWLPGCAIFALSWALINWSMAVNPFFEKTVRIQTDHGHRVIDTGPYAYVRHPGYVGFSGWLISTPLLLSSTGAFIPVLFAVCMFVIRTMLEDRTLCKELNGYAEYATRVRFRLIPGIW